MRTILRAVGSLLALAVLVIGVPVLLVAVVGRPLPVAWPDWADVWLDIRQLNIDPKWVTGGLAVGAWLLWAQVIWALLFELVNMARAGRGVTARSAPLTFPAVATLTARLVAGVVSVTLLTSSPSSAGVIGSGREMALTLPDHDQAERITVDRAPAAVTKSPATGAGPVSVVVAEGETAWDVAVRVFGDGRLVGDLLDHNEMSALDVQPGMELELPPGVSAPADRVTVAEGDHLWALSTRRLEQVGVDEPSNAQIAAHVEQMVEANQPAIVDPDLIHPGEVFTLPALGDRSKADDASRDGEDDAAPASEPPTTSTPTTSSAAEPAGGDLPAPTTTIGSEPPVGEPTEAAGRGVAGVGGAEGNDLALGLVAVTGIGLITAAVGAIVARSEAQLLGRRRPGTSPRFAVPGAAERLIAETSDDDALNDLDRALRYVGMKRNSDGFTLPDLVGVLVYPDTIRLLVAAPNTHAPEPFTVERDGMVWAISRPVPDLHVEAALNPYPTLISVGYTDAAQLLVDIEYVGSLSLTGGFADVVDEMATMALQLATSPLADTIEVVCVGFGEELADFERITVVPSIDSIQAVVDDHAAGAADLSRATGNTGPGGRADGVGDWTPMVVFDPLSEVVNDSSALLAMARATPSAGVSAVLNSVESAALSVELGEDGLTIPSYQVSLSRRPLTRTERLNLSAAVAAAKEPDDAYRPDLLSAFVADRAEALDEREEHARSGEPEHRGSEPDHEYRVRLLGPLRVETGNGEIVRFARSATPEFLAYLTRHRDGVEVGHVMTTLWPSTTARRTWIANVYADAARSLAAGNDRSVSLTPRPGADDEYRLSSVVTSDLEQFQSLISRAVRGPVDEAVELLTDASVHDRGCPVHEHHVALADRRGALAGGDRHGRRGGAMCRHPCPRSSRRPRSGRLGCGPGPAGQPALGRTAPPATAGCHRARRRHGHTAAGALARRRLPALPGGRDGRRSPSRSDVSAGSRVDGVVRVLPSIKAEPRRKSGSRHPGTSTPIAGITASIRNWIRRRRRLLGSSSSAFDRLITAITAPASTTSTTSRATTAIFQRLRLLSASISNPWSMSSRGRRGVTTVGRSNDADDARPGGGPDRSASRWRSPSGLAGGVRGAPPTIASARMRPTSTGSRRVDEADWSRRSMSAATVTGFGSGRRRWRTASTMAASTSTVLGGGVGPETGPDLIPSTDRCRSPAHPPPRPGSAEARCRPGPVGASGPCGVRKPGERPGPWPDRRPPPQPPPMARRPTVAARRGPPGSFRIDGRRCVGVVGVETLDESKDRHRQRVDVTRRGWSLSSRTWGRCNQT